MGIKPIQTSYKGYKFRSRLEARWAVFFDTLGVRWEYEKEGYDLGSAGWYLPDFWLPYEKIWIEIKGQYPTTKELKKAEALAWGGNENRGVVTPVVILYGVPGDHKIWCFLTEVTDSSGGEVWFTPEAGSVEPFIVITDSCPDVFQIGIDRGRRHRVNFQHPCIFDTTKGQSHNVLINGIKAACSARFEHGARG